MTRPPSAPTRTRSPSRTSSLNPSASASGATAAVALLGLLDAAGVIVMMVGHNNGGAPPSVCPHRRLHGGVVRVIN